MAVARVSIFSDAEKTDTVGTLILNIPCAYDGDIDTYLMSLGPSDYIMCAGYVAVVGGVKYPVLYADQYDSSTGAINLYTPQDLDGAVYYIEYIVPDFINLPQ